MVIPKILHQASNLKSSECIPHLNGGRAVSGPMGVRHAQAGGKQGQPSTSCFLIAPLLAFLLTTAPRHRRLASVIHNLQLKIFKKRKSDIREQTTCQQCRPATGSGSRSVGEVSTLSRCCPSTTMTPLASASCTKSFTPTKCSKPFLKGICRRQSN